MYLLNGCKGTYFVQFEQTKHHFSPEKFGGFEFFFVSLQTDTTYLAKTMTVRRKRVSGCSGDGNRVWRRKPRC